MNNQKVLKDYYKNHTRYIFHLNETKKKSSIGNKALNLRFLQKRRFKIPKSFVCSFQAFNQYRRGNPTIISDLTRELQYYINEDKKYSIRSSANIEDESNKSFAGQFKTLLNQKGIDNLINGIVKIWDSLEDIKPLTYSKQFAQNPNQIKMGIIIQEMVYPKFSGVVFTRNPLTGLDEVIIESVKGLGESLVQIGETPERWVYKWGDWIEIPDLTEISKEIIEEIVHKSIKIAKKYGEPLDLEWAYDDKNLYWLQLRKITTLKHNKLYSNKLSKEFMPGMIKPLIWSVNIPVVNTSWKRIFEQLIGSSARKININQLAHPFYYRSYFNMKIMGDVFELLGMPRDLLEILAGIDSEGKDRPSFKPSGRTLYFLPRIVLFGLKMYAFSKKIEKFLRAYKKKYADIDSIKIENLDEKGALEIIDRLFKLNTQASYMVIISQLLNSFYNKFLKNKLKKKNIEFENLDFSILNKRISISDPRSQMAKLNKEFKELSNFKEEYEYKEFLELYSNSKAVKKYMKFISDFGFLRDNGNDFSEPSWNEKPELIFKMIANYEEPRIRKFDKRKLISIRDNVFSSPFSKFLFNRAIKYQEYRQTVTNLYTYGYGLFRKFFLRISDILINKELIKERHDIFYLTFDEMKDLIENNKIATNLRYNISKRKLEMAAYANLRLPEIIYDDFLPKPINTNVITKELTGIATSKGYYIGPVKIIKGIDDINKIQDGDIIIIPYSDVSWTPLFSKAKAVISESGGMLSHCSIVAREYKIPAVVSVEGAMLLKDDLLVAVDAYKGKISILNDDYELDDDSNIEMVEILKQ